MSPKPCSKSPQASQTFLSPEAMCAQSFGHVRSLETLWTIAHQAPLCMGFFRQEFWNGLLFPPPEDFSDPGIESMSLEFPALQADSVSLSHRRSPSELYVSFSQINVHELCPATSFFCFIDYTRVFDCVDHKKTGKFLKT